MTVSLPSAQLLKGIYKRQRNPCVYTLPYRLEIFLVDMSHLTSYRDFSINRLVDCGRDHNALNWVHLLMFVKMY